MNSLVLCPFSFILKLARKACFAKMEIRIECYDGWRNLCYIREPSRLAQVPLPAYLSDI